MGRYGPHNPDVKVRKLTLNDTQRARVEEELAAAIEDTAAIPGTWLNALAYLAAPNYNRTAFEVMQAWGLAS